MRACLLIFAIGGSACFAEAPSVDCPVGSKGCPCTDGGACDALLECHEQSQACYDPECAEGSLNCPCFQGMCFGDLMCADGLCQQRMQSNGSDDADESTTASTGSTSSASVGGTTVDTNGTSIDDTECAACFAANIEADACAFDYDYCEKGAGCRAMRDCIVMGNGTFEECCGSISDGHSHWSPLAECLAANFCSEPCMEVVTSCPET